MPACSPAVAAEFAKPRRQHLHGRQEGAGRRRPPGGRHPRATDAALADTVAALDELEFVTAVTSVLRLEGTDE